MVETPVEKRERNLATSGQAEFTLQPPKFAKQLRPQKACTCIDKLVDEERERHAKNIAFQKALVRRIEASERRISFEPDDDDDDDDEPRRKGRKKKAKKTVEEAPAPVVQAAPSLPKVKPPTIKPVFDTDKCVCYKKIIREERKRKKFVRSLEREQRKFEKNNLKAQRKYEKERKKAYRKCDYLTNQMNKKYGLGDKTVKINQGDETYAVFLHMDPGDWVDCTLEGTSNPTQEWFTNHTLVHQPSIFFPFFSGCSFREKCFAKFKKCFYKYCVWIYVIGGIIGFGIYYLVGSYGIVLI